MGLTKLIVILLYVLLGGQYCSDDLVGVPLPLSPWRYIASTQPQVEEEVSKHAAICRSHGYDFFPFRFLGLRVVWP